MKRVVERYVQQVRDGSQYKGHVKVADTKFDYELNFVVPISKLDSVQFISINHVRSTCQLKIKKDGADIELTDREYAFFFKLLVELAVDFYKNPQTRDGNENAIPVAEFWLEVPVSLGATSTSQYELSPQLCEMLSASKFGCTLV